MTYMSCCGSSSCGYSSGGYSLDSIASSSSYSGSSGAQIYGNSRIYTLEAATLPIYSASSGPSGPVPLFEMASGFDAYLFGDAGYRQKERFAKYAKSARPDYFMPAPFLKPNRPFSRFVGDASEIQHYVDQIFELTTGKKMPEDIMIEVISEKDLSERHARLGGSWRQSIQGFSLNNRGFGASSVVVKKNRLDELLITIGHEIGHLMSFTLRKSVDEEAKAFAFEMAWIEAIHEHDIAGLKDSINLNPKPASNGLHDIAFGFVKDLIDRGRKSMDVFKGFVMGELRLGAD